MYIILVGVGKIGIRALEFASKENNDIVVIDKDKRKIDKANMRFDSVFIQGDATFKKTLKDAKARKADALITTTGNDATNLLIMKNAKELGIPKLTSVVNHESRINHFKELDINIVGDPYNMIGKYLYRSTKRISTKSYTSEELSVNKYMKLAKDAEVFEISVSDESSLVGKTLREVFQEKIDREDYIIIAIDRDNELIIPKANTEFRENDQVTVFSKTKPTDQLISTFRGGK